ncbi:hypoxia induced protein conserved region-domain-containing protein [Pyronema omphalodes]|nr:hypoxia induced protein conserved region-domain-containing protein [Pyronema omphalodes]
MSRQMPSSFDDNEDFYSENRLSKIFRRLKEEPLVPIGVAITCIALYKATRSIRAGNKEHTNKMFRARIYGQAFTVAAMIGGSYYYQDKREAEKALRIEAEGIKAKERQNAWIKELEEREREDKEIMERAKKLAAKRKEVEKLEKENAAKVEEKETKA